MSLFNDLSTEKETLVYFLDLDRIRHRRDKHNDQNPSQLVVRCSEWDGESSTEVEECLYGQRNLLVVVEWDVLNTFYQLVARRSEGFCGEYKPYIHRACHGIERAR